VVAVDTDRATKAASVVVANVCFLYIHAIGHPYTTMLANVFEALSITTLAVLAAILSITTQPVADHVAIPLTVYVLLVGCIFLGYLAYIYSIRCRHRCYGTRAPSPTIINSPSGSAMELTVTTSHGVPPLPFPHDMPYQHHQQQHMKQPQQLQPQTSQSLLTEASLLPSPTNASSPSTISSTTALVSPEQSSSS
jgi:hypothetical protein